MRFPFACLPLCLRLPSSWICTLPSPSRGELWRRRSRLVATRVRWSLHLQLQAFTVACSLSSRLRGRGGGVAAADYRPVHSEPECGLDSFSDGDFSDGSSFCAEERLDGLHRSEGCLPSDSDPPCIPQVSSRRADLAVPGSLLQSVHSPTGFHSRDGSCVRIPPSAGSSDASVSRRLADPSFVSGGSLLGKGSSSHLLSGAGNCGQPGEVDPYSVSTDYLHGNQDQLADFQGFGDSLEDRKVLLNSRRISVLKGAVCEVLEGLAGPPHLSFLSGSEWSASNESFATGSKSRLGFSGRGGPDSPGSSFSGRSSVVVHRRSSQRGDLSSPVLSRPNVLVRRLQPRLGGRRWQTISPQAFGWRARPLF